ncbi:BRO family protein [Massilia sp. YIM B02769]|uniref:BRO-N domain-containing protein n=1 Tax=Massilia sp. YIM B02769 TaxID=3050129 RepID=UPI0025B64856|nr:BRO family protein [Massilia sp. YIM B02769]
MNSNTPALAFEGTNFDTVQRKGQIWLRAAEIAQALGYSRADKVTQIYERNKDEFSSAMTLNLKLRVKGFGAGNSSKDVRVFSLRGAHLIAMFARTPVAKAFRRWVLDILDRQIDGLTADAARGAKLSEFTMHDIERLCTQAEFLRSWWERFGDGIRVLNRKAAGNVHDNFVSAASTSRSLVRAFGFKSNHAYAETYPWEGGYSEREDYRKKMERIEA